MFWSPGCLHPLSSFVQLCELLVLMNTNITGLYQHARENITRADEGRHRPGHRRTPHRGDHLLSALQRGRRNRHFDRACSKCSLCRYVCINLVETDRGMGMCHRWALSGSRHDADQCLCEELQQLDSTQSHSTPTPVYYSAAGLCGFHKNVCAQGPLHSDVRSEH